MIQKSRATTLVVGIVAFLSIGLLFACGLIGASPGPLGLSFREITAVFRDGETQWIIFLFLGIDLAFWIFLRLTAGDGFRRGYSDGRRCLSLAGLMLVSAMVYAGSYTASADALVLLFGGVVGHGVAVWSDRKVWRPGGRSRELWADGGGRCREGGSGFVVMATVLFVILLALASILNANEEHPFAYHFHTRWTGPWDNPNIFGVLMGTGWILTIGLIIGNFNARIGDFRFGIRKYCLGFLFVSAAVLVGRGLLHSYSRGAWCATACGISYLAWRKLQSSKFKIQSEFDSRVSRLKNLAAPFSLSRFPAFRFSFFFILASGLALCFWEFRGTEWHPARRVLSVAKTEDFSWRNRVTAWEGALQITAERPWFGAGWNQPELLYQNYYLPPKLTERAAIAMNDYLMLGATLGVPALFCFAMYVWLTIGGGEERGAGNGERGRPFQRSEVGGHRTEVRSQKSASCVAPPTSDLRPPTSDFLSATCHAGAIVLLVGFWFDGGLFKLPTAVTFWILLELGSVQAKAESGKQTAEI